MIVFVEGIVRLIRDNSIVVYVQGLGYEIYVSDPFKYRLGQNVFLYTYHQIREDAQMLFGFENEVDYEVFMRLINVKGIGAKTAIHMLSRISGSKLIEIIENGDLKALKALPGIGAKGASQIVLDLQGRLVALEKEKDIASNPIWVQTQEALVSLGYKPQQLQSVKKELENETNMSVDEMLRKSLKLLAQRKGV